MMKRPWLFRTIFSAGMLVSTVLLLSGCPKRPDLGGTQTAPTMTQSEEQTKPAISVQEPPVVGAPSAQHPETAGKESPLKDVFFDFDSSAIREDARPGLKEDLQWLNANSGTQITIEGHCDERGTAEYNLALGERRAKAAKDYLVAAGIDIGRLKILSFGKERPFAQGHDESAWKWNRRAHFVADER